MKIFSPDIVADVKRQDTAEGASTSVVLHGHSNKNVLDLFSIAEDGSLQFNETPVGAAISNSDVVSKLSVVNGALCYNGQPVDTVGFQFVNETVLSKFSVSNGVLMFDGQPVDTVGDSFVNKAILAQFSVVNGVLMFDGQPVDTVGHEFVNALVLDRFSVVNNVLLFNGQPVDTTGHVFNNASVLDLLTVDGDGKLLFNGAQIQGAGGTTLPNADVLTGFAVDANGSLTFRGSLVGGTQSSVTVVDSQGNALTTRTNLKFVGLGVADDSTHNQTVVTGITDSSGLTHNSSSMASVLNDLQSASGKISGKSVDLTNLTEGSVLAFSQASNSFKVAQPAIGASGQGLYVTDQFTVGAGQEVTVTHQQITNGRAVYQADQYIVGAAAANANHFAMSYDVSLSGLAISVASPYDTYDPIRLPFTYGSMTKNAQATFPVATCMGLSYVVDSTVYVMPLVTTNWASTNVIYQASISAPTSFTSTGNSVPVNFSAANGFKVFKYNGALYVLGSAGGSGIYKATVDAPTVWTQVGSMSASVCAGAAFIVGSRVYVVAGQVGGVPKNNIYSADMSNLNAWTTEANTFPVSIGRTSCYQYGNYLYVVGGETVYDSVYSNAVYRAHVSAPTVWTQVGTIPSTLGSIDDLVVHGGRVFIFGGRINAGTYSTTVFHADASNPTSWTVGTAMTTGRQFATKYVVDDQVYVVGGFNGTWLSSIECYTLTPSSSIGSGVMTLNKVNTALVQTISDVNIYAKIPASTSIKSAVSFDGGATWSYYNTPTSGWVQAASQAEALAAGAALTLVSGYKYLVAGLTNFNVGSMQNIQISLLVSSTVVNQSPVVYYSTFNYVGVGTYGTLLIGSYSNGYADIGLKHPAGVYSTTNIKNNQSSPITMVLKVCDGTI